MKKFSCFIYPGLLILLLAGCASDKAIYRGQVKEGIPHGTGKKIWPDGTKYQGEWANGEMSGNGVLTWADSKTNYAGQFSNGKRSGLGKMSYSGGEIYDGEWSQGQRSGQGKMSYLGGDSYEGAWADDKRSGTGIMKYANSNRYEGGWSQDVPYGTGTLELNNGNYYMGKFDTEFHGDGAGLAYYYAATSSWCIVDCNQISPQFAVVSGSFVRGRGDSLTVVPCGTNQQKCKAMVAPAYAAIGIERARKLAEAEREKHRLAEEAEKERARKEAALLAEQKRKEDERLAFLNTGTASQVYMLADKLETDKDFLHATEAYRVVVTRFPESAFSASAMARLGAMRDKRDQQEAEQRKAAIEAEQRRNDEALRKQEAEAQKAERKAERDAEAAQRQADRENVAQQRQNAATGAACVEAAKALCDQTTSGLANTLCKASAGIGCN